MRLNRLFAVVAPIVLLLPLAAHAEWPKGEREKYMAQCVALPLRRRSARQPRNPTAPAVPMQSNRTLPATFRP